MRFTRILALFLAGTLAAAQSAWLPDRLLP